MNFTRQSIVRKSQRLKQLLPGCQSKTENGNSSISPENEKALAGEKLNRIISAKAEMWRRFQDEQEAFAQGRREHEQLLIEIDEAEVEQREIHIANRKQDLKDKECENTSVQEIMAENIRVLEKKLDAVKVDHNAELEAIKKEIAALEDELSHLKTSLTQRVQKFKAKYETEGKEKAHAGDLADTPAQIAPSEHPTSPAPDEDEINSRQLYGLSQQLTSIPDAEEVEQAENTSTSL